MRCGVAACPPRPSAVVAGSLDADEEQKELDFLNDEAIENGLTKGESSFELLDPIYQRASC